jgi:hypothetical protein
MFTRGSSFIGRLTTHSLVWGAKGWDESQMDEFVDSFGKFDIIVGSEIVYYSSAHDDLVCHRAIFYTHSLACFVGRSRPEQAKHVRQHHIRSTQKNSLGNCFLRPVFPLARIKTVKRTL